MSDRNHLGDATTALVALLRLDLEHAPEDLASLRTLLQRAAFEEITAWERVRLGTTDHDTTSRARRWARAIESTWELAALEFDVALGRRRAGAVS